MLGAIVGDIVGSRFEWHNIKVKDFDLFTGNCYPTDDSILTLALGVALCKCKEDLSDLDKQATIYMQEFGLKYPNCGFGGSFLKGWLLNPNPQPYGSCGNGAAMRVSPCAYVSENLEDVRHAASIVTNVSHNHPESIMAVHAVVDSIFLARHGFSMEEIKKNVTDNYYPLNFTLDEIRPDYDFDVTCQGSVPQALEAFFESTDFEDAIKNAISLGGDSDTIAAIAGSVAGAYYGIPKDIAKTAYFFLDKYQRNALKMFEDKYGDRMKKC